MSLVALLLTIIVSIVPVYAGEFVSNTHIPETGYGTAIIQQHTAAFNPNQNEMLIFGGSYKPWHYSNDLWSFSLDRNQWAPVLSTSDKITERMAPAMWFDEQKENVYIFGGFNSLGQQNDLWIFIMNSSKWKQIPSTVDDDLPSPRLYSAYTQIRDKAGVLHLYIFGGMSPSGKDGNLYSFNTETQVWTYWPNNGGIIQPGRQSGSMVAVDGYLYLWGGSTDEIANEYTYRYDFEQMGWFLVTTNGPKSRCYAGTAVLGDSFYYVFGWDESEQQNHDGIDKFNTTTQSWSQVEIDRDLGEGLYKGLLRNDFAYTIADSYMYIHGGYGDHQLTNSLARVDLASDVLRWEIISSRVTFPSARDSFSFDRINDHLFIFGGLRGGKYSDELWEFNIDMEEWEIPDQSGTFPSPRSNHASSTLGSTLFIYGGKDRTQRFDDLWSYNSETRVWASIEPTGVTIPNPRQGACMVNNASALFIVGGRTDNIFTNAVWAFDLGTYEYEMLKYGGIGAPIPGANYNCLIRGEKIIVLNGESYGTTPLIDVHEYDIIDNSWKHIMSCNKAKNLASVIDLGDKILTLGGQQWNIWSFHEIVEIDLARKTDRIIGALPQLTYGHQSVYYKDEIYTFGGGASLGLMTNHESQTNYFVKTKLTGYSCSLGTRQYNGECIPCPPGTYNNLFYSKSCTTCRAGSKNAFIGSENSQSCQPCPSGEYNDLIGQRTCKQCLDYDACTVGSIWPMKSIYIDVLPESVSEQPETYQSRAAEGAKYNVVLYTLWALALIASFTITQTKPALRKWLKNVDNYKLDHNHILDQIMYVKATQIGGVFTLMFLVSVIFVPLTTLITYTFDNIIESKSLVPFFITEREAFEADIQLEGKFEFWVKFFNYGGECVNENLECHEEISLTAQGMQGKWSDMICTKEAQNCAVKFECSDCIIDVEASVLVNCKETDSYATSANVQITSFSSLTGETSFVDSLIKAPDNEVLRGPIASYFPIKTTTTMLITDEPGQKGDTGYHVAVNEIIKLGSTSAFNNLYEQFDLKVEIGMELSESTLEIQRMQKMPLLMLFMTILSTIVGIMGAFGGAMKASEAFFEKRKKAKGDKQAIDQAKEIAEQLENQLPTVPSINRKPLHNLREEDDPESESSEIPDEIDSPGMEDKSKDDDD